MSPSSVRFWSDYNRLFYHPRSLVQLHIPTSHLQISNTQLSPFDRWDVGEELFQSEDQEHDLLDRDLRPFIEECDQMQGLQVITGADDAWAGFASRYVERIRDEFGRKSVWVWGLEEGRDVARVTNSQAHMSIPLLTTRRKNVCSSSLIRPARSSLLHHRRHSIFRSPTFHLGSQHHTSQ
jgi:hypothetical protein